MGNHGAFFLFQVEIKPVYNWFLQKNKQQKDSPLAKLRKDQVMPYVEVNLTTGASKEQKAQLVEGITDLLVNILDKNPSSTQIVIKEIEADSWGISGRSVKTLRAEGKTAHISKT